MARVAVLHNTLDFQGGADAVCLAVCEALTDEHEVTLFTLSETPLDSIADRFDRDVTGVTVRMPPGGHRIASALATVAPWTGPQLGFRSVLLERYVRPALDDFDLAVSTANEFAVAVPSVQYVHFPQFNRDRTDVAEAGRLNWLWSRLAGPPVRRNEANAGRPFPESTTVLANSRWTAGVFEEIYGVRPTVTYPPVDRIDCEQDWADRERGIVALGRIAPDKRFHDAIDVVDRLRERGYDLHLHIAGSTPPAYRSYVDEIAAASGTRPYVDFERNVSRDRIRELLCSHRYGLNTKTTEHFGMAVAEYVAAGMLPFAPANGGQQEILGHRTKSLFDSVPSAVDRIASAVDDERRPSLPRDRFSTDRFQTTIRQHVNRTID